LFGSRYISTIKDGQKVQEYTPNTGVPAAGIAQLKRIIDVEWLGLFTLSQP
jgi:hypothetical protein